MKAGLQHPAINFEKHQLTNPFASGYFESMSKTFSKFLEYKTYKQPSLNELRLELGSISLDISYQFQVSKG